MKSRHSFFIWLIVLTVVQSRAVAENNQPVYPAANSIMNKLAMQWGEISAARQGTAVVVIFTCYNSSSVDHFQLQRSIDGVQWETVSSMQQLTTGDKHFELQDAAAPEQGVHYRVLSADTEGTTSFSKTIAIASSSSWR